MRRIDCLTRNDPPDTPQIELSKPARKNGCFKKFEEQLILGSFLRFSMRPSLVRSQRKCAVSGANRSRSFRVSAEAGWQASRGGPMSSAPVAERPCCDQRKRG